MNVCIWYELFDGRKTLTHSLSNSLTHSDTHVFMYADNSNNMTQTYDRRAKSEKRKAKNKKNLDFDEMNICIWHELFDWRTTLTLFLTHSLTQTLTYTCTQITVTTWHRPMIEKRKAKNEKRKSKSKKQNESRLWRNECLHMAWAVWLYVKHSLNF